MSYSRVKPTPPKICWAMAVTSRNVWQANSLAIGASRPMGRPVGRAHAASWTRVRAPSTRGLGVGQVVGDGLEGAERLVELLAVLGVLHGDLERAVAGPDRPRSEEDHGLVEHRGPRRPAGAGLADALGRGTRTPSSSTWYWVSDAIGQLLGERDPVGLRVDEEQVDVGSASPVRASTSSRSAAAANGTCHLVPVSAKPAAVVAARVRTPGGPKPLSGSSHAGREDRLARGDPGQPLGLLRVGARRRPATPAAITALTKCGDGASDRPSSS